MKIGIWGTSKITNYHIDALMAISNVQIIAIHGTHIKSGETISQNKKIPFLINFEDFLQLKPEMILITNSVDKHWPSIKKLLLADIYIICEKPLLANRTEFNEFSEILRQGKFHKLNVISQKKYDPDFLALVEKSKQYQSPKYVKIHIRKDKKSAGLDSQSASRELIYSQLPHALDLLMCFCTSPISLDSVSHKKIFNSKKIDYLNLSFSGDHFSGTIEIESFYQKNFPNSVAIAVINSTEAFYYPPAQKWTDKIFNKKRNKNDNTVFNLKLMYIDFFDKIKKQESVISDINFKADILTNIHSLIQGTK